MLYCYIICRENVICYIVILLYWLYATVSKMATAAC